MDDINTNIEISNISNHFFIENRNNDINDGSTKKFNTKIIYKSFSSMNEMEISNKIKKIPYYYNNYSVIENYENVNITLLNENYIEKIDLDTNVKYFIFKYKNGKIVHFNDYLFTNTKIVNPKRCILYCLDSFLYILYGLNQLLNNDICFFDLSSEKIMFHIDCGEKPLLHDFQHSLQISKLNDEYITNIIKQIEDFSYKPLEVHILFYFVRNEIVTLSYSFIEEISEKFVDNLHILRVFNEKFKENYQKSCIETLKKYINKAKKDIIEDILKKSDTWDVYSISVIYLHIFSNISRVFSLKRPVITSLILELTRNINPEPLKRTKLPRFIENCNNIINN